MGSERPDRSGIAGWTDLLRRYRMTPWEQITELRERAERAEAVLRKADELAAAASARGRRNATIREVRRLHHAMVDYERARAALDPSDTPVEDTTEPIVPTVDVFPDDTDVDAERARREEQSWRDSEDHDARERW
jgi:hypothetical protein